MSAAALEAVTGPWVMHTRIESRLAGVTLASSVPVSSGSLTVDTTQRIPERVELTVPREADGVLWDPRDVADHPLAPWGQRLIVRVGVELTGPDDIEWLTVGQYLVYSAEVDGDDVQVEAWGLLQLLAEARLLQPITSTARYRSTLSRLVGGAMTIEWDEALGDPEIAAQTWEEDRLQGILDVLDSWPADAVVTPVGRLSVVTAADSTSPVLDLDDTDEGTVVRVASGVSREDAVNMAIARGDFGVSGVAYEMSTSSPLRYGGPFNPLPVPDVFDSTLLTTEGACQRTAAARLRRRRKARPSITAETMPHPGLQVRDAVRVTTSDGRLTGARHIVDALRMPLTPDGGTQQLTLRRTA